MHSELNDETQLSSACILVPMLCVRPSSGCVRLNTMSSEAECVPEAELQSRLFCKVGFVSWFVCLANVPDLVCRLIYSAAAINNKSPKPNNVKPAPDELLFVIAYSLCGIIFGCGFG